MGHRLMRHLGRCQFPHGHTYAAAVTVEGPLNDGGGSSHGMVVDFRDLDSLVKAIIEKWDHAFMLEQDDPFVDALARFRENVNGGTKVVVVPWTPTAENIARCLFDTVRATGRHCVKVRVDEGPRSWAEVTE